MTERTVGAWVRRLELGLVVLLLSAAAELAVLESRSELAKGLRTGAPLVAILVEDSDPPAFFGAVYRPRLRALDLVKLPNAEPGQPKARGLERLYKQGGLSGELPEAVGALLGAGRPALSLTLPAGAGSEAPALRRWILSWPRGLAFWRAALGAARRSGLPLYEAALLALEAYRLAPADIRPVWLPAPPVRERLAEVLTGPRPPPSLPAQIHAEVLNASGEPGVAQRATKVLRWHEVDVMDFGNAPGAEPETRIVDRAGKPEDARYVARLLGCADAEVWTQLDPQASVPLSIVLGRDFRRCLALPSEP